MSLVFAYLDGEIRCPPVGHVADEHEVVLLHVVHVTHGCNTLLGAN